MMVSVAAAVTLVSSSCGGAGGTGPTPPSRLHLRAGLQVLDVIGFAFSSDPLYPPCTPVGAPAAGTGISTRVMLEQTGADWIARSSSSATGTLEIRIQDTGSSSVVGDLVSGSIQGTGIDVGEELRPPNGVAATFSGATLDGTVRRTAFLTTGRIAGSILFTDASNAVGACQAVQWQMQPVTGVFGVLGLTLPHAIW